MPLACCSARAARRHRSSAGSGGAEVVALQLAVVAALEVQRVGPVDQHEHRLQQVVAVGAPADDVQEQVQLGRRRQVVQRAFMRAAGPSRRARIVTAGGASRRGLDPAFGAARQADVPAELLEAGFAAGQRLRCARRARGGRAASRTARPAARARRAPRSASASRSAIALLRRPASASTHVAGLPARLRQAWCRAARSAPVAPLARVAAQLEGRAAARAPGRTSTRTLSRPLSTCDAVGMRRSAGWRSRRSTASASSARSRAPRSRAALHRLDFQPRQRLASAPRWRRRGRAPRARRGALRRAGRIAHSTSPRWAAISVSGRAA